MATTVDTPAVGRVSTTGPDALRNELRDLYEEIADLLDDDRVEELPGYFIDECVYRVTTRENYDQGLPGGMMFCEGIAMLRDRILAIRETQVYEPRSWRHFISGVRVLGVDGDVVRARANFLVTESMSDTALSVVGKTATTNAQIPARLAAKSSRRS